jgi:DNA invertase Pin-like site-specific DNA recombinase
VTAELAVGPVLDDQEWADVAYSRISDDRSGEGANLTQQRKAITQGAADEGRTITHWFEDTSRSAFKPGVVRDDFEKLLQACAAHAVRRGP